MYEIERISTEAIPSALEKAQRYRLLNEPLLAESICLDVLAVDPDNQTALVTLILSLSDQLSGDDANVLTQARDLLKQLEGEYERAYYAGILAERRATALLEQGGTGRGYVAYDLFREAIRWYDEAGSLAPAGVDDAILRRNTCIRLIEKYGHVRPAPDHPAEHMLE